MIALLALACGGVAALPFVQLARRELVLLRVRSISVASAPRRRPAARFGRRLRASPLAASVVRVASVPRVRHRERASSARLRRELPVVVDLVGV
ncbi:MAG TPA: hypothetical protein VL769_14175, partial [Acidimicrobiia bacterium]|nr:hypothetical protein [Acidimicrobiia bacterium]